MPEETARDRASQLRRPRQARVSMRRAGEPLRWRRPCLGSSDGSELADLPRMERPDRLRSGLDAVWTKQNAFLLQYTLSQPALDAPVRDCRSVGLRDRSTVGVDGDRSLISLFASEVRIAYAGAPSNAILADDVIHWPSGDCGEDPGTLSVP